MNKNATILGCFDWFFRFCINFAVTNAEHIVAVFDIALIVSHHDDGRLFVSVKFPQVAENLRSGLAVEFAGRFIGEHDLRVFQQGPGNRDTLLFAARELIRCVIESMSQPDLLQ